MIRQRDRTDAGSWPPSGWGWTCLLGFLPLRYPRHLGSQWASLPSLLLPSLSVLFINANAFCGLVQWFSNHCFRIGWRALTPQVSDLAGLVWALEFVLVVVMLPGQDHTLGPPGLVGPSSLLPGEKMNMVLLQSLGFSF